MMCFVRGRHSRNYLDGRSDSIDVFQDPIEGTDIIDAWIAPVEDEYMLHFRRKIHTGGTPILH